MSLNFSLYFILYKLLESRNRLLLFLLFSHCLYLRYTMWRFGTCINDEVIITVKLIGTPTTPMRALRLWPRGADRSHGLRVTSPGLSISCDQNAALAAGANPAAGPGASGQQPSHSPLL